MLPSPRRVPCTFNKSETHIKCGSLTHEASAQLPSALPPDAAVAKCHARPTRAWLTWSGPAPQEKLAASRRQHCGPMLLPPSAMHTCTSVTHITCASPTRVAGAKLLAALQPNAAVAASGALHAKSERMHAPHERDSHQVRQPHTRGRRPAALSAAAQCCHQPAERRVCSRRA